MYIKVTRHISPNLTVNHPPMRFGPNQRRRTTYLFAKSYKKKTVKRRRRPLTVLNKVKDTMPPPHACSTPQNAKSSEDPLPAASGITELEHFCTLLDEKTPRAVPTRVTPGAPLSLSATTYLFAKSYKKKTVRRRPLTVLNQVKDTMPPPHACSTPA